MAAEESRVEASPSPSSSVLHVVVFPWLAFGHMIPFLELSKQLARRGHAVTFVTTPRNAARLLPAPEEQSAAAGIRVVKLELPEVEGLPAGAESTADVPPEKVELLKKAFDGLAAPFADLVAAGGFSFSSRKPDWMILDFAQYWAWPIAEEHKIASAFLFILPVSFLVFVGPKHENEAHPRTRAEDFMVPPPWLPPRRSPSTAIAYRRHEADWIAAGFLPNTSGVSDVHRVWVSAERCRLVIDRSCPEAEPGLFPVATDLFAKPVVPAGLLLPADDDDGDSESADHGGDADDDEDESGLSSLRDWLDAQPARSVLYVAFGSEAPLTPAHVRELARGLELSGVRFLWALRETTTGSDMLPDDGFLARVSGRGLVRVGWVPQVRVLAHAATGAFLTHCGWGSTVESLFRFGLPLVMLPFIVDQGLIARAMAARGVGVEVARDDGDGSFTGEDVAAAVRRVMVEEEAFARNAANLRKVLGDRATQDSYFEDLVQNLQRYKF
ncbi:hypothetical protein EJB05_48442, partial [Eragrostis curvula]